MGNEGLGAGALIPSGIGSFTPADRQRVALGSRQAVMASEGLGNEVHKV